MLREGFGPRKFYKGEELYRSLLKRGGKRHPNVSASASCQVRRPTGEREDFRGTVNKKAREFLYRGGVKHYSLQ